MGETNETKLCKYCQMEIPKKAKICPNCKKKQGGKLKWIVIAVIAIIVIAAIAGGDDDESNTAKKVGESKETETVENTEQPKQEENKSEFRVGDIVETEDLRITFINADKYEPDNEFIDPSDGNVFYRMEFEFENISDSDQTISSMMDWECYADDYSVDQSWVGDDQIDATLSPGKKVKGSVYFEIPSGAESIVLEYETNFWTEDKIVFVVK